MTIKQQGGVFGRNPTFNDVEVASLNAETGVVSGVFRVDTDTFYVDPVNNRVGIGTAAPAATFQIANALRASSAYVSADATGSAASPTLILNGDADTGFFRPTSNTLAISTFGFERLRVLSSGGITFNGDTAADNALDDYEEGTFTPVVADAASGGNAGTALRALGYYTKIGQQVTVIIELTDIDTTGLTAGNDLFVTGLPFTAFAPTGAIRAAGSIWANNLTLNAATPNVTTDIFKGHSYLRLLEWGDGVASDYVIVSQITSGTTDVFVTATYFAA